MITIARGINPRLGTVATFWLAMIHGLAGMSFGRPITVNSNAVLSLTTQRPAVGDYNAAIAEDVLAAERRLSDLGYWTGPVDGKLDEATRFAILAFQRTAGLERTGRLTPKDLKVLKTASKVVPVMIGEPHVEVNLTRQTLLFVDRDGVVSNILPITTGTGRRFTEGGRTRRAMTPQGTFTVYRKLEGWRKSPLGEMYYPSYIIGGVAIHGSRFVPNHRSTHGCIAVPLFAAEQLSKLMHIGIPVVVHN